MYSRCFSWIFFSVFIFAFCSSCSNENKVKEREVEVFLDFETSCIDEISETFEGYFEDRVEEIDLQKSFLCMREAIDYFDRKVRRADSRGYTPKEITHILNKFFEGSSLKLETISSIMEFKSDLIGGSPRFLSKIDMGVLKTLIGSLEKLFVDLKPYGEKIVLEKSFETSQEIAFVSGKVSDFLTKWLFYRNTDIGLQDLFEAIFGLAFEENPLNNKWRDDWVKVFDGIRGAGTAGVLLSKEKSVSVAWVERLLGLTYEVDKSLSKDWQEGRAQFGNVRQNVNRILATFADSLHQYRDGAFPEGMMLSVLGVLNSMDVLPEELSTSVLQKHISNLIIGKYFKSKEPSLHTFDMVTLDNLKNQWSFLLSFIDETIKLEGQTASVYPSFETKVLLFDRFLGLNWPLMVKKNNILLIDDRQTQENFTFQGLLRFSWQTAISKILIETYSSEHKGEGGYRGLLMEEVRDAYGDLFDILLALDVLDADSRGSWFRIFNEANLFVPSTKPDDVAGFEEMAEYFSYLFSALEAGDLLAERVEKVCPQYLKSCVLERLTSGGISLYSNLPSLNQTFDEGLSDKDVQEWKDSFEYIAKIDNNPEPFTSGQMFRGTVGNQYVETIFRKYDVNSDDGLDFSESQIAFESFKEALKFLPQVRGTDLENDDLTLLSIFTFFIKEGRLPKLRKGRPSGEIIRWRIRVGRCQRDPKRCKYNVSRSRILALLAFLTSIDF